MAALHPAIVHAGLAWRVGAHADTKLDVAWAGGVNSNSIASVAWTSLWHANCHQRKALAPAAAASRLLNVSSGVWMGILAGIACA